jgi:hypothetical protein
MEGHSANDILKQFFEAHQLDVSEEKGWIIPNSNLPAIRSSWYPNEDHLSGLLQIEVFLGKGIIIEECFAGLPNENGKLNDAFENFSRNSLHVLLSAFWEKLDPDQVDVEEWKIGSNTYSAYIGPFGNRGGTDEGITIPEGAFEKIEKAIKLSNLTGKHHWFRTYYCNSGNGDNVYEALQDNQIWEEGLSAIKSVNWEASAEFYSTRNFLVLIKNT